MAHSAAEAAFQISVLVWAFDSAGASRAGIVALVGLALAAVAASLASTVIRRRSEAAARPTSQRTRRHRRHDSGAAPLRRDRRTRRPVHRSRSARRGFNIRCGDRDSAASITVGVLPFVVVSALRVRLRLLDQRGVERAEAVDVVATSALFDGAPGSVLGALAFAMDRREFGAGTVLVREGDVGESLYLIAADRRTSQSTAHTYARSDPVTPSERWRCSAAVPGLPPLSPGSRVCSGNSRPGHFSPR